MTPNLINLDLSKGVSRVCGKPEKENFAIAKLTSLALFLTMLFLALEI